MSYRIEGKDIVISGFQEGIADSPYAGIGDMRNIEITSIPGEASVNYSEVAATQPPVYNGAAYTADPTTDRLTVASVAGMYEGVAISLTETSPTVEYLVVAGGGGGAGSNTALEAGGGGGAGGMKTGTTTLAPGAYTITVGAGGAGGAGGGGVADGTSGSNSSIAALVVSTGGGGGGKNGTAGVSGGSGGGAGGTGSVGTLAGGAASPAGQGNAGGSSTGDGIASTWAGAGGGGAGAVGSSVIAQAVNGGNGGAGSASSISGASVTYAGGGGGGARASGGATKGSGGAGGGGAGGDSGATPTAGTANTGGGGGGAKSETSQAGAAGGSGVVVIRYTTGSATATGGTITTSGGYTIHTFTTGGTFTVVSSLAAATVYYVRNIVGLTFQLSEAPQGSILDITGAISGTYTTYQYGNQRNILAQAPVSHDVDRQAAAGGNAVYVVDGSNYAWFYAPDAIGTLPANSLIFMGNIGGIGASSTAGNGVSIFNGFILLFGGNQTIDIADINDLVLGSGPAVAWDYGWQTSQGLQRTNNRISTLVSEEDGNLYWTSTDGLGSIIITPGDTFDPGDSASFTVNDAALAVPGNDNATCIAELGTNLLIGGQEAFVYIWDKISLGFTGLLNIPDRFTTQIVAASQNAYVFAGNRGRIYITNGSGIDLYKKIPDYVTGMVRPYIRWWDASFARNQLYFGFSATNNADSALTTVAGAWAIDLDTDALRLINKTTNTGYTGTTVMVIEIPNPSSSSLADNQSGSGVTIGWFSGTTYGIDVPTTTPYVSYEAYAELDMIPVGTYLNPFTPSQIEWKTSYPLGGGGTAESIRISYRQNLLDSFTTVGTTTATGTSVVGSTTGTTTGSYAVSDYYKANFQKVQWAQLKLELSSNATTPTYNRVTEIRIRDWIK